MVLTVTVMGADLSRWIISLEHQGFEIRSLERGKTNAEWVINYDDMKEANEQLEIFIK